MLLPALSPLLVWGEQRMHWQRMKHQLLWANLTTIEVPRQQLQWVRPGKEISWQGHHFDVKHIRLQANGRYRISGMYDYAEASIKQKASLLAGQAAQQRQHQCLQASLLLWVSLPPDTWHAPALPIIQTPAMPARPAVGLWHTALEVPTPPPLVG